jgi:hypothetical protein
MAPTKGATLASMVDDLSEDDLDQDIEMLTPESQIENKQPAKRKAGRPKTAAASKTTKSKVASRRASGGSVLHATVAGAKKKATGRKALAERTNVPEAEDGNDTEEVDDFDDAPPAKTKRGAKAAQMDEVPVKQARKGRKPKAADVEFDAAPAAATKKAAAAAKNKGTRGKRSASVLGERIIPETQPDRMDIEETDVPETEETLILAPEPPRQLVPRPTTGRARSISRQPDILAPRHRRGGSASDTERAGEPALRRKLGEITKKFENLDLKYRNLKELGTNESQSNFDKLRKSADQRAKGTNMTLDRQDTDC